MNNIYTATNYSKKLTARDIGNASMSSNAFFCQKTIASHADTAAALKPITLGGVPSMTLTMAS